MLWKPGSSSVEQPYSDCNPALGAPPWDNTKVEDDALIKRENAVRDPQWSCPTPTAPRFLLSQERGAVPSQAPAESALHCRAQINIVKANVKVVASRLQESNCSRAGSRGAAWSGGRGPKAQVLLAHRLPSSFLASQLPSSLPESLLMLLPLQALDPEASTAGAEGAV